MCAQFAESHRTSRPFLLAINAYTAVVTPWQMMGLVTLGLAAGAFGGMLGIGGSVIMIPVLTLLLGVDHHLTQAVAMIVNVFVSVPAMIQHHRAGAVRWPIVWRMLPAGIACILIGVNVSNLVSGEMLERIFGAFLLYVAIDNILRLLRRESEPDIHEHRVGWIVSTIAGGITGFTAGVLGVGGGIVAVPLLQRAARLPLRQCIATTAAFMCFSATIGAVRKNLTLSQLRDAHGQPLGLDWHDSLTIAAFLAPTAVLGGMFGGRLTHRLPLTWVRVAFILLMIWAGLDMLRPW